MCTSAWLLLAAPYRQQWQVIRAWGGWGVSLRVCVCLCVCVVATNVCCSMCNKFVNIREVIVMRSWWWRVVWHVEVNVHHVNTILYRHTHTLEQSSNPQRRISNIINDLMNDDQLNGCWWYSSLTRLLYTASTLFYMSNDDGLWYSNCPSYIYWCVSGRAAYTTAKLNEIHCESANALPVQTL